MAMRPERRSGCRPGANESPSMDSRSCCAPQERRRKWSQAVLRSTDRLQMSGGQSGQQVLRFQADRLVPAHGKDQVDRLTGDLVEHIRRITKIETEYSKDRKSTRLNS